VQVSALDDDGDPIRVEYAAPPCAGVAPASLVCAPGSCGAVEARLCAEFPACGATAYAVAVRADDGASAGTGSLSLDAGCTPPKP
jgi:hypothetical protein